MAARAKATIENQDEWTIRDEANALVCAAFRTGFLEDLHAGEHSPLLDDPTLSRITDAEMKALMTQASTQLARLLWMRHNDVHRYAELMAYYSRHTRNWDRTLVDGDTPAQRVHREPDGRLKLEQIQ